MGQLFRIGIKIVIAVGLALCRATLAAPPDNPDAALAPWFESLKQPLQGFGDGPGSRPPDIVCHRASLYKAGANGTFPSAWLREVAAPAGKNGLALGKAEEL